MLLLEVAGTGKTVLEVLLEETETSRGEVSALVMLLEEACVVEDNFNRSKSCNLQLHLLLEVAVVVEDSM